MNQNDNNNNIKQPKTTIKILSYMCVGTYNVFVTVPTFRRPHFEKRLTIISLLILGKGVNPFRGLILILFEKPHES